MLAQLRTQHIQKKILVVLSIMIIPGFIAWGTASFVASQKRSPVMEIAGEKIFPEAFEKAKKDVLLGQFLVSGKDFYSRVKEETINAMTVERFILLREAAREKLTVTDQEVVDRIKTLFSVQGKFRKEAYDNFLRMLYAMPRLRYTVTQFEDFLRDELRVAKMQEQIFKEVRVDAQEVKNAFLEENEEIKISFALLSFDAFKQSASPARDALEKFYNETREKYTVPPKVEIAYLLIPIPLPEQRNQPSSDDRTLANTITSLLRKDKDPLKILSKKFNAGIETQTIALHEPIKDFPYFPELNQKLFSSADNRILGPLFSPRGFLVVKKLRSFPQRVPAFTEAALSVKEEFMRQKAREHARRTAQEIIELFKNSTALETIKKGFPSLVIGETGYFSYARKEPINGAFTLEPDFIHALMALSKNETTPEPVPYQDTGLLVAKVLGKKAAKNPKGTEEEYRKKVLFAKRITAYVSFLQKLEKELKIKIYLPAK